MADDIQIIGGEGILTTQAGNTWIIETDPSYSADGGAAFSMTDPVSPSLLTYTDGHGEQLLDGHWSMHDFNDGLRITIQTGTRYDPEGDRVIYGFVRHLTFNSFGQLVSVSAERRIVIDIPEAC